MNGFGKDIYTEPASSADTLANLGPLAPLAGVWTSDVGADAHPAVTGIEPQVFVERIELQPIDAQTNGPQLFYGLRYHTQIMKPGDVETFHDQVGYWLWEPSTGTVIQTLAIPRGQSALAIGHARADATTFRVEAVRGAETNGILSNSFLEYAFKTMHYAITISVNADGTWSYSQDTVLLIPGQPEPFQHTDRNTLRKVGEPTLNPRATAAARSLRSAT